MKNALLALMFFVLTLFFAIPLSASPPPDEGLTNVDAMVISTPNIENIDANQDFDQVQEVATIATSTSRLAPQPPTEPQIANETVNDSLAWDGQVQKFLTGVAPEGNLRHPRLFDDPLRATRQLVTVASNNTFGRTIST